MTWIRRLMFSLALVRVYRFPLLLVLVLLALSSTAASAPDSMSTAVTVATFLLMVVVPFVPLAHLHLDGPQMVLVSMGVAFIVAIAAQLYTGDLKTSDLQGGIGSLFLEFGKLWAIEQAVFQLFKDNPTVGPLLTTKPILAPAAPKA